MADVCSVGGCSRGSTKPTPVIKFQPLIDGLPQPLMVLPAPLCSSHLAILQGRPCYGDVQA